jgi:DNA repair protein RecO (recombination protein O)
MNARISYKTEAIILRSLDYGESDRIITFYTSNFGKIKGIAKGAKRSKKRFANVLELFVRLQLLFSRRRYDGLALIEEGTVIDHYPQIRNDLHKTLFASYMMDVTDQFTVEHKENAELYCMLQGFLKLVTFRDASEDLVRFFEMRLLKLAGYEPVLDRCMVCKMPVENGESYHFSTRDGGLKCGCCSQQGYDSIFVSAGTVRSLLLGKSMENEKLLHLRLSEQSARESRLLLGRFIEYLLGKEVKSLHVIREIYEMEGKHDHVYSGNADSFPHEQENLSK